jgi:hypothetical protein
VSHFEDALALLRQGDQQMAAAVAKGDPQLALEAVLAAAMSVLVAQVHATLAIAERLPDPAAGMESFAPKETT